MFKEVEIQNLKCESCARRITSKLGVVEGVKSIKVQVESSVVKLELSDSETLKRVEARLSDLGYPKIGSLNGLGKKAKSYMSCAIGKMN